jgi:hypothetical protein
MSLKIAPAWKMAARDRRIGWSEDQRTHSLQSIVDHSRFPIPRRHLPRRRNLQAHPRD